MILSSIILSSCATTEHRFCPTPGKEDPLNKNHVLYVEDGIYPATRLDYQEIKWLPTSEYRPGRIDYFSNFIYTCMIAVDFPISFLIDTILFPYDIFKREKSQPEATADSVPSPTEP